MFRLLAKLKGLRGTPLDIFGYSEDRRLERSADRGLREGRRERAGQLSPANAEIAVELLSLPDRIRGYGPVKEKAVKDVKARHEQLIADLASPPPAPRQIAAE